ncbi:MAG TPA: UvrD-helicase domain-containing protein, partial [Thermoanaerobaculia bacterium]
MKKSAADSSKPASLPDDAHRAAIREDLDTTMLVEAAAGTGKTSCLVDRMVALVATGRATVDRLSAVTFTIKAAAQLRQRFQNGLEESLRTEREPGRRAHLAAALARLDSCFLGTIHAFAARLLRERPVEAGVDPGFEEMDEPENGAARSEAWDRFAERLFLDADPRLARLIDLDVPLENLRETFETVCENSDVDLAIGPLRPEPDFADARREVAAFLEREAAAIPAEAPAGGWSEFQAAVRRARRLLGILDVEGAPELVRILKVLRPSKVLDSAGGSKKPFEAFRERVVKPALAAWAEYLHPFVMPLLREARDEYGEWRRREGRLNFQDLLLYARDLLRDHPRVREALRGRFTPILVDEFQDTDPIQAEILFYLTGANTRERDWTKLTPVAGSLFVVGDPKQSIYRFRRADIEIYEEVRERIGRCGRFVELSTSFRSSAGLCDWVNGVFGRMFPNAPTRAQAAYVGLSPARTDAPSGPSVFRLDTPSSGNLDRPVVELDATRVANAVATWIAARTHRPGDFLLLFRRRRHMADYARALERRGVPYEIAGGGAFRESADLDALMPLLEALADPENPVPCLAALRGPIFGVDDEALYRFARSGGRFSHRSHPPEDASPKIRRALELLREGEALVETLPPAAAVARLLDRIGWGALAAAEPLGDSRAGNLLKALAAARTLSGEGLDFSGVVRELQRFREEELIEQMSSAPGRPDAVRLMTLHGAKGLEARVVFLADPTGETGRCREYVVDREVEPPTGHFRVTKRMGEHGREEIARPVGWDAMQQTESRFDAAEKIRLLYVGATRARDSLIVSIKRTRSGDARGPWAALAPHLRTPLPDSEPSPLPGAPRSPGRLSEELAAFRVLSSSRREAASRASYRIAAVTDLAHSAGARPMWERTGRGMSWGRVLHGTLEALMRNPDVDVRVFAANLLAAEERPAAEVEEILEAVDGVRRSDLWRSALAAKNRLVEVPFAIEVAREELGFDEGPARTLLQGVIDLVYEEGDGWVLVDYKSDTVTTNNLSDLV